MLCFHSTKRTKVMLVIQTSLCFFSMKRHCDDGKRVYSIVFIKLQSQVPLKRVKSGGPCILSHVSRSFLVELGPCQQSFISAKMKMNCNDKTFYGQNVMLFFYGPMIIWCLYVLSDNQSFKFNQNVYRNSIKFVG